MRQRIRKFTPLEKYNTCCLRRSTQLSKAKQVTKVMKVNVELRDDSLSYGCCRAFAIEYITMVRRMPLKMK